MERRVALAGGVILGTLWMLVAAWLQPVSTLQVTTGDGVRLSCVALSPGDNLTLSFTHSMYGGFVRETYAVDANGHLVRQSFITEYAASAEYYATDGRVRHVADGYEVIADPFATDELVIRVDGIGRHRMQVAGMEWPLFELLGEPAQVRISGDRIPRFRMPAGCVDAATHPTIKGLIA
jgi:hypothetical protein